MKITVCQLHNGRESMAADWGRLVQHVRSERSAIVLLPEMPFFTWFPTARRFDARIWGDAIAAHDEWETHLSELMPALALGTRPVHYGVRYSVGFMWNEDEGITETLHAKTRLSSEEGSWETSWYDQAVPDFKIAKVAGARIGMLIGLELWLPGQAKLYGEDGAQIIAVPRVDRPEDSNVSPEEDEWLAAGRDAAKASGAWCISSTRGTRGDSLGGAAWIVGPDGQTHAVTSADEPIASAEVGLT
jgi:predicted amidohydrolase